MTTIRTLKQLALSTGAALLLATGLASFSGLAASESEGPAEKAGQQIDQKADQAAQAAAEAKESARGKAETTGEYMDDSAITAKVKLAILRDPTLKVFQISVTTTNGVVKLTGAVESQLVIDRASAVALETKHVKSVDNALTVKGAS